MNQTTQMYEIAKNLTAYDCWFSQFYTDNWAGQWVVKSGILDNTIIAGKAKEDAESFLKEKGLNMDYKAQKNTYDLALLCTDMYIPANLKNVKKIWIQEGMTDDLTTWGKVVKYLGLPGYVAGNTALNGTSNLCDIYCAASEGYKWQFQKLGTDERKILATGIPNYDNIKQYEKNTFPFKNFVMVATSDIRELLGVEDRPAFIRECVKIANGRQLIFKIHPNEIAERAISEIKENSPEGTLIFTEGNIHEMIANCDELITQYSTVVYTGLALGKKCHSYFDIEKLKSLTPVQNNGNSARIIANIAHHYLESGLNSIEFLKNFKRENCKTNSNEALLEVA